MSERAQIRDELLGDPSGVVAAVMTAVTEEIPAYRALGSDQLAEVGAIADWATRRVLDLWVEGSALDAADLNRFKGIGAARALDGRPLPVVLRAYRVAAAEVMDLVVERGGDRLTLDDAMALTRLWLASVDALSEALYTGYSAAATRRSGDHRRALGDLLNDLVDGRQASPSALADRCRALEIVLPQRPAVLVVQTAGATGPVSTSALAELGTSLERGEPGEPAAGVVLTGLRGTQGVALVPAGATGVIETQLRSRRWRGCVVEPPTPSDAAQAYRLASLALAAAPERAFADRALLVAGDAQVLALLTARPGTDPVQVVRTVLGPVLGPSAARLREGLDAYLETGSAVEAAGLLGLHPQTLRYRLRRVVALTGRDPRRPWDRFVLEVARTAGGALP